MPKGYPKSKLEDFEAPEAEDAQGALADPEVSPQYKHAMKLKAKAKKQQKNEEVSRSVEMVASPQGRIKYRHVIVMTNGNVYRLPISKAAYEKEMGTGKAKRRT
jgi:hypothetical protein